MMPSKIFGRATAALAVSVCIAALLLSSSSAHAQSIRAERPYQGLFASIPQRDQRLDAVWSIFGVYDDNVTGDTTNYDPRLFLVGKYALTAGALSYVRQGTHSAFSVNGRFSTRLHSNLTLWSNSEAGVDVTATHNIGQRRRLNVSLFQSVQYVPYYQQMFAFSDGTPAQAPSVADVGAPPPGGANPDAALTTLHSYAYEGRVQLSQKTNGLSGSQFGFGADYGYRLTQFANAPELFSWQLLSLHHKSRITRSLALKLGYGYGIAHDAFILGPSVTNHNVDVGVDYARALSRSRRTHVAFASGFTVVPYKGQVYSQLIGDAVLSREIGRTWSTSVSYHRGVQYVEWIAAPLGANTIQLRLSGFMSRRLQAAVQSGYSLGKIGFGVTESDYRTGSAIVNVRFALSRTFSIESEYGYYAHDFNNSLFIRAFVPDHLQRQSGRIGVTGWIPVFQGRNPPPGTSR